MSSTTITLDVTDVSGNNADCSFAAEPATWAIRWVWAGGEINAPGTANTITFEIPVGSAYKFVGIRLVPEPTSLPTAPVHSSGLIPDTVFSVAIDAAQKKLTIDEGKATWQGWKTWHYSIGVTDGSANIYWCDPKIYNKGDS